MTNPGLLAAVHAAAHEPAPAVGASTSQHKESSMAETQNGSAAAPAKVTTLAELRAAHPELCNSLATEARAEGATAERARIAGIEALGAQMKGHDKLISELKADGSVTVEAAMSRLWAAEGAAREAQLQGIKDVEKVTGKVAADPKSGVETSADAQSAVPPQKVAEAAAAYQAEQAKLGVTISTTAAVDHVSKQLKNG